MKSEGIYSYFDLDPQVNEAETIYSLITPNLISCSNLEEDKVNLSVPYEDALGSKRKWLCARDATALRAKGALYCFFFFFFFSHLVSVVSSS